MYLFSHTPGTAVELPQRHVVGSISTTSVIGGDGQRISFPTQKTIITKIGLSLAGNYQFLHTLGNDVFVYVFGDRMGQVSLHCLSFAAKCNGDDSVHGFQHLYDWYRSNRIANSKELVTVTINNVVFSGFLIGSSPEMSDPETRITQTQLVLSLLPTT